MRLSQSAQYCIRLLLISFKNLNVEKKTILFETIVEASAEKVWRYWISPHEIKQWNNASDDWHTPHAENDLWPRGKFTSRMEARDGSAGFDFSGTYRGVASLERIRYIIDDGRNVTVLFSANGNETKVTETFEAEDTHPFEMQKRGWQVSLDNFKTYTESH